MNPDELRAKAKEALVEKSDFTSKEAAKVLDEATKPTDDE
jgi:hypothetical protein